MEIDWRKLRRTILVVAVLLVVSVGSWGVTRSWPQSGAIDQFCTDLNTQNYKSAFELLSSKLRGEFTGVDQFKQGMAILDTVGGTVSECGLNETSPEWLHWVTPGASSGARFLRIHRKTLGDTAGRVHMTLEGGMWKIDKLDESLLTVSLGAVGRAVEYCNALEGLDFSTAYAMLSATARNSVPDSATVQTFTRAQIFHYIVDGRIAECTFTAILPGESDNYAGLHFKIMNSNTGPAKEGDVKLSSQDTTNWSIDSIDQGLQGTSTGPLEAGYTLCDALATPYPTNLESAYNLLSPAYQAQVPYAKFAKMFPAAASDTYYGCLPDFSTYKISQTSAAFSLGVNVLGKAPAGSPAPPTPPTPPSVMHITLGFVYQSGTWAVNNIAVST